MRKLLCNVSVILWNWWLSWRWNLVLWNIWDSSCIALSCILPQLFWWALILFLFRLRSLTVTSISLLWNTCICRIFVILLKTIRGCFVDSFPGSMIWRLRRLIATNLGRIESIWTRSVYFTNLLLRKVFFYLLLLIWIWYIAATLHSSRFILLIIWSLSKFLYWRFHFLFRYCLQWPLFLFHIHLLWWNVIRTSWSRDCLLIFILNLFVNLF